jgi:hypothetical protein
MRHKNVSNISSATNCEEDSALFFRRNNRKLNTQNKQQTSIYLWKYFGTIYIKYTESHYLKLILMKLTSKEKSCNCIFK